jgi:hypothetical protein
LVAKIEILLLADGNLGCQITGQISRAQFLMMIETAKDDALRRFHAAEDKARGGIEVAPPNVRF